MTFCNSHFGPWGGNGALYELFPALPQPTARLRSRQIHRFGRDMPRRLSTKEVAEFFARFAALDPDPRSELQYVNPYTLLVAVVLSAQATDKGVNKATAPLFAQVDTPEKMVALGEERLRDAIKTIGLF